MLGRLCMIVLVQLFAVGFADVSEADIWKVPSDFKEIQDAIDSPDVAAGDTIVVSAGHHRGANVTKGVIIRGEPGAVIRTGPKPWPDKNFHAGFLFRGKEAENGSGARILKLKFEGVDFPIFASQQGAVIEGVIIKDCVFVNAIQAITMWHADGWEVSHNWIKGLRAQNGGGIGLLVGSYSGDDAFDNVIERNRITGVVRVHPEDKGGYNAAGIYIVSDHRRKNMGGMVEGNLIARNVVELQSTAPYLVPVVGIEIEDTRHDPNRVSVTENEVISNILESIDNSSPLVLATPEKLSGFLNKFVKNELIFD